MVNPGNQIPAYLQVAHILYPGNGEILRQVSYQHSNTLNMHQHSNTLNMYPHSNTLNMNDEIIDVNVTSSEPNENSDSKIMLGAWLLSCL